MKDRSVASAFLPRILLPAALLLSLPTSAQTFTVTASVEVASAHSGHKKVDRDNVVVWLTPFGESGTTSEGPPSPSKRKFTLLQKDKSFAPHVLVIPAGAEVEFPNRDPFFHNVFSLFEGQRFDLGLYEAGTARTMRFSRPGISYLFCNIHSEMSAVIIALDTPYYATSDATGQIAIPAVPAGRYQLHVWREGSSAEALKNLSKLVVVSHDPAAIGQLVVPNNAPLPLTHKNKYGRDYDRPSGAGYDDH